MGVASYNLTYAVDGNAMILLAFVLFLGFVLIRFR